MLFSVVDNFSVIDTKEVGHRKDVPMQTVKREPDYCQFLFRLRCSFKPLQVLQKYVAKPFESEYYQVNFYHITQTGCTRVYDKRPGGKEAYCSRIVLLTLKIYPCHLLQKISFLANLQELYKHY